MTLYKITEFYIEWFSVCPNINSIFFTFAMFKTSSHKITIQVEFVGTPIIFHCTKLHLSKYNGS
jgi:hypothetical protein